MHINSTRTFKMNYLLHVYVYLHVISMLLYSTCAAALTQFPPGPYLKLNLSHLTRTRTNTSTYIGVWRKGLFVITAPPLRLGSSLRGGVSSWRALALLSGLTVCRRHWLTLERDKDTERSVNAQTLGDTTTERHIWHRDVKKQIIKHVFLQTLHWANT